MKINSAKDLRVYQKAYALAMEIFTISLDWPDAEEHALTGQIRRSSRSACANLREAWVKRRYEAHFVKKLTHANGKNSETETWLDFAKDCGYLEAKDHTRLTRECQVISAMLGSMLNNRAPFLIKSS